MITARVLVCGGRDYDDQGYVNQVLDEIRPEFLIQGGAPGADRLALYWALNNGVPYVTYPAEWDKHGRAAGPIRNQRMLDEGKPTLVVVFPGGRGTADMKSRALKARVPVADMSRGRDEAH